MSLTIWRRSWTSLLPLLVLGLLLAGTGAVLQGSPPLRIATSGFGLILLGTALVMKRTELHLAGNHLAYRSIARRWGVDLSTVDTVDVPSNYRLLYLTIVDRSSERHRLPILNFETPRSLAEALVDVLPPGHASSRALETLQAISRGQRVDQVVRWREKPK